MVVLDRFRTQSGLILICDIGRKRLKKLKKKLRRGKQPSITVDGEELIVTAIEYGKSRIGLHIKTDKQDVKVA